MNIVWKIIRKPLVWRALFVLSVFSFNLFMDHNQGTIAMWTFFSVIFAICIGNTYGQPYKHKQNYLEKQAKQREIIYGSRSIHSFSARKDMLGY